MEGDVYALLGRREDDHLLTSFLQSLQAVSSPSPSPIPMPTPTPTPTPTKRSFSALAGRSACDYHNYKSMGLSLCFEAAILRALHLYNASHGYACFPGHLPYGLRMQMRAAEVVRVLKEPDGKLGGGRGGPISLTYKDKGLQINFVGCDWEDKDNILDSITIHEPI